MLVWWDSLQLCWSQWSCTNQYLLSSCPKEFCRILRDHIYQQGLSSNWSDVSGKAAVDSEVGRIEPYAQIQTHGQNINPKLKFEIWKFEVVFFWHVQSYASSWTLLFCSALSHAKLEVLLLKSVKSLTFIMQCENCFPICKIIQQQHVIFSYFSLHKSFSQGIFGWKMNILGY